MDRRSWLWRRKSSEKSSNAETDSSESVSSHSERVSDEQVLPNHIVNSPEVTSKPAPSYDELQSSIKILSSKLSEALHNIDAKEELVKQHGKVAEEAVSGWEKAETEVSVLRKQLDIVTEKNIALEGRVGHLDGALKQCLRQLRQVREEQEQKIHEAISQKERQYESAKLELENQIAELQSLLETTKTECVASTFPDLCIKLEAFEKENAELKFQLLFRDDEVKVRTCERDLSTLAAETASKQYLESIKKVAKLEAECRKLKMLAHKAAPTNDYRPATASSGYVESYSNGQSDCGESLSTIGDEFCKFDKLEPDDIEPGPTKLFPLNLKSEVNQNNDKSFRKNFTGPSNEIALMDDFLEMEKFAALPAEMGKSSSGGQSSDELSKAKFESLRTRTSELEKMLKEAEAEKVKLKTDLYDCENHLQASRDQLEETTVKLIDLQSQLVVTSEARRAAEAELEVFKAMLKRTTENLQRADLNAVELQNQLTKVNEAKLQAELNLKASNEKLVKSSKCLEEAELKLVEVQGQLSSTKASLHDTEAELESTKTNKEVAESRLRMVQLENQKLHIKINNLEIDIKKEQTLLEEADAKCQKLKDELSILKSESLLHKPPIWFNQDKELAAAAGKFAECQKTIASLDQQLKSLASLEDLLIDSEMPAALVE